MDVLGMANVRWKTANIDVIVLKAGPAVTAPYRWKWYAMMEWITMKVRWEKSIIRKQT